MLPGKIDHPGLGERRHLPHHGVIEIERGEILRPLVFKGAALGRHVVFHAVFKAVEMILGNIEHAHGIGPKVRDALQLQGGHLRHHVIPRPGIGGLLSDGDADIAQHEGSDSGSLEKLAREGRSGGFAIGAADADEARTRRAVAVAQLDLTDHLGAQFPGLFSKGSEDGNYGAKDDQVLPFHQLHRILPKGVCILYAAKRVH